VQQQFRPASNKSAPIDAEPGVPFNLDNNNNRV
jgi:hypothetical protein